MAKGDGGGGRRGWESRGFDSRRRRSEGRGNARHTLQDAFACEAGGAKALYVGRGNRKVYKYLHKRERTNRRWRSLLAFCRVSARLRTQFQGKHHFVLFVGAMCKMGGRLAVDKFIRVEFQEFCSHIVGAVLRC